MNSRALHIGLGSPARVNRTAPSAMTNPGIRVVGHTLTKPQL